MNNSTDMRYGVKTPRAGVNGLGHPKEAYSPSKHNPGSPVRPGALDALNCPSVDMGGISRPYWGSLKTP